MTTTPCVTAYPAWRHSLLVLTAAAIGLLALLSTSCSTRQRRATALDAHTATQRTTSELMTEEARYVKTSESVPTAHSTLTLPSTTLHELPQGLPITERSGRASVRVLRLRDSVYITAQCDSLERAVETLILRRDSLATRADSLAERLHQSEEARTKTSRPLLSLIPWWLWLALGWALGARTPWLSSLVKTLIKRLKNIVKTIL